MTLPPSAFTLTIDIARELCAMRMKQQAMVIGLGAAMVIAATTMDAGTITLMAWMVAILSSETTQRKMGAREPRTAIIEIMITGTICEVLLTAAKAVSARPEAITIEAAQIISVAPISIALSGAALVAMRNMMSKWALSMSYRLATGMGKGEAQRKANERTRSAGEATRICVGLITWGGIVPNLIWALCALGGGGPALRLTASAWSTGIGLGLVLALAWREPSSESARSAQKPKAGKPTHTQTGGGRTSEAKKDLDAHTRNKVAKGSAKDAQCVSERA